MSNATAISNVWVIMQYTLRESLKNRILWIAVTFAVAGVAAASFVGDFAIIETRRAEAGILSSLYRFAAAFAMIIFVVSTMAREFNDKCLELYLSFPISRLIYFVGKLGGFFVTGLAVALVYGVVMLLYAEPAPLALWLFSLVCELMIVAVISFFCVLTFNQQLPASVITAFFFYLLCRAGDDIVLISQSELILHTPGAAYLSSIVNGLSYILPSLGRFTRPEWLIYSDAAAAAAVLPLVVWQTLIYTALLGAASMFDFSRKNL